MNHRPPKLWKDHSVELARSVFGSVHWTTWKAGLLIIGFLISLNLFSSSIYDISEGQFECSHLVYIPLFALSVFFILWIAEDAASRVNLDIVQTENPQPCTTLILFLSPPGRDEPWIRQALQDTQPKDITNDETRKQFQGSWRMPIEAIAYHLNHRKLEKIVILPSSDSPNLTDGTYRYLSLFIDLIRQLTQERKFLHITGLHEIDSRWEKGVDYETAQALVEALNETFQWLRTQGLKNQDILVDITAGQKISTIAGAAVALGKEQWFQYVSTRDYKVRAYDITYRASTNF